MFDLLQLISQWDNDLFNGSLEGVGHDVRRFFVSQLDLGDEKILNDKADRVEVCARSSRESNDSKDCVGFFQFFDYLKYRLIKK